MRLKSYIPPFLITLGMLCLLSSWWAQSSTLDLDRAINEVWQVQYAELLQDLAVLDARATAEWSAHDWSPWVVERYQGDSLIYWSEDSDNVSYGWSQGFDMGDHEVVVRRFALHKETGSDWEARLMGLDLLVSEPRADSGTALPFARYVVVGSDGSAVGWQYVALAGFLMLLCGGLWLLARKLRPAVSLSILLALGFMFLLSPVEYLWPDLIVSNVLVKYLGMAGTLTDLITITAIAGAMALLVSSKAWPFEMRQGHAVVFGLATSTALVLVLRLAQGIVSHPSIQLEINQIFRFDKYSVIVLVCIALMSISHLLICVYTWYDGRHTASGLRRSHLPYVLLGVLLSGAVFVPLELDIPFLTMYLFLVSYYTMIDLLLDSQRKNITWLIWWIMILSALISVSVFYMSLLKSEYRRSVFVDHFFQQDEVISTEDIFDLDRQIRQSGLFEQLVSTAFDEVGYDRSDVLDYLYTLGDLRRVRVSVEGFDQYGEDIFRDHFALSAELTKQLKISKRLADYAYYDPLARAYILKYELVGDTDRAIDLYVTISGLKGSAALGSNDVNFVIYQQGLPVYHSTVEEPHPPLDLLLQRSLTGVKLKGWAYDVARSSTMTVVAYSRVAPLIKPISMFSYVFILIGLLTLVLTLANSQLRLLRPPLSLKFSSRSTLRNKIQLVVILLVLFSFVVIGVLTAFYFKNVIHSTNRKTVREQTTAVVNNISSAVQNANSNQAARTITARRLQEISTVHDRPLALFDRQGALITASPDYPVMSRLPYETYRYMQDIGTTSDGVSADLSNSFVPLYHIARQPYAIVGIHHDTNIKADRNLLDFLSTIVNVYVFLFLLGGAMAIIIANSITRPLSDLGEKLKSIKLGRRNEPLQWKSNDEIGALIQDYNNLIVDLERSANIIAMTERDTAWREMAKQVAHEIKNPLTPMKLSIQYLQRAGSATGDNKALIDRVSNTLIEQIDNLTQIANEFSNFASMPMASNEKLLLNSIVEMIHELFRKREDMDIHLVEPITDLWVYADKNHLIRVLNNILKNAIQAIPADRRGNITISLYQQDDAAIVQVRDNGVGIPDDKKDKVFTPHFTTKSSGTGLGLAISVNMLEAFNGRIYFDTVADEGTSFFVEIPLMRLTDTRDGITRVLLD